MSEVFRPGNSTTVVISDACLVILEEYLHRTVPLEEYLSQDYPRNLFVSYHPGSQAEAALGQACNDPYTSYSDIDPVNKFLQFGQQSQAETVIRHPRQLNIRNFESGNFVLIGGPLSIPWYRLSDPLLNFVFETDFQKSANWIRNKAPQSGEPSIYASVDNANVQETFALISVVPNLRHNGRVLILAGMTMTGTEAASQMIWSEDSQLRLQRILDQAHNRDDVVEILLRVSEVAGVVRNSRIEAYRVHSPKPG